MTFAELLGGQRVLPAVTVDEPELLVTLGSEYVAGGITRVEVLLRTDAALAAIERASTEVEGLVVGAGTVREPGQVDAAVAAGASFVVSPGLSPAVADRCGRVGVPYLPGVFTATEILAARALDLRTVKLFPAALAGLVGLRQLSAAFDDVRFVPTGGVTGTEAPVWLAEPGVLAVGGSWLAPAGLLAARDWPGVRGLIREAARL